MIEDVDADAQFPVDLLIAAAASRQTNTEARFATILLNPRVGGAWATNGGGLSQFPEYLHLTAGPDMVMIDQSAEVERFVHCGGLGLQNFNDAALRGGNAPAGGLGNIAAAGQALGNYITPAGGKAQALAFSMLMLSAGVDETHTRHSCGEQPTVHGTALDRAIGAVDPTRQGTIAVATMTARRRQLHTAAPLAPARAFQAVSIQDSQVLSCINFRTSPMALSKFARLRLEDDDKLNGVAFMANILPAINIAGELVEEASAAGYRLFLDAYAFTRAHLAAVSELSSRVAVFADRAGRTGELKRRFETYASNQDLVTFAAQLVVIVEEVAANSDLLDSPALLNKTVTDLGGTAQFIGFRARIQARITAMTEVAVVELRLATWVARPAGQNFIHEELKRLAMLQPAARRNALIDAMLTELANLNAGTTVLQNSVANLAAGGFAEAAQWLNVNALAALGYFAARRAALGPAGFDPLYVMRLAI